MTNEPRDLADFIRALRGGGHTTTVQINAGGVGVWLCTTALAIVCALAIVGAFLSREEASRRDAEIRELRAEVKALNDYLAAIYMQAPHLRPKADE